MKIEIKIKDYYEPLSLNDVRLMLHISKRKASHFLKSGYIRNTNSGKKTRQYSIKIIDFFDYLENGGPKVTERNMRLKDLVDSPINEGFKIYLQNKWKSKSITMTPYEASLLIGYCTKTILKWIHQKKLKAIYPQGEILVPKDWLIDFLFEYGHTIENKCNKHINIIKNYYHI